MWSARKYYHTFAKRSSELSWIFLRCAIRDRLIPFIPEPAFTSLARMMITIGW